uniref:Uncharacterized protein n=1 Tax=Ascaris lumbricoides TaxID=6252 RepID=A0A0M3I9V4_ASCLU
MNLSFKWGNDIHKLLLEKLQEYGYVLGKKKLFYVSYENESTLIDSNVSLLETIEECPRNGYYSIRIENSIKPPRRPDMECMQCFDRLDEPKNRRRRPYSSSRSWSPRSRSVSISNDEDRDFLRRGRLRTHRFQDLFFLLRIFATIVIN